MTPSAQQSRVLAKRMVKKIAMAIATTKNQIGLACSWLKTSAYSL